MDQRSLWVADRDQCTYITSGDSLAQWHPLRGWQIIIYIIGEEDFIICEVKLYFYLVFFCFATVSTCNNKSPQIFLLFGSIKWSKIMLSWKEFRRMATNCQKNFNVRIWNQWSGYLPFYQRNWWLHFIRYCGQLVSWIKQRNRSTIYNVMVLIWISVLSVSFILLLVRQVLTSYFYCSKRLKIK